MDQELVQYLDERFNGLVGGLDRRFDDVNERIRHNGVIIEGLRDELHLVADGLLMHIDVRHREDRDYFDGVLPHLIVDRSCLVFDHPCGIELGRCLHSQGAVWRFVVVVVDPLRHLVLDHR